MKTIFVYIIVSVFARLVGDEISKWLNKHFKSDKQPEKNPQELALLGGSLLRETHKYNLVCGYTYYTPQMYFCQAVKNYSAGKASKKKTVSTIVETAVGCGGRI